MKSNHEINHTTKTILLTKEFLKAAGCYNTTEFNQMCEMRAAFPNYTLQERTIEKNPNKQTYGKLTYDAMRDYIKGKEETPRAELLLAELEKVIEISKTYRASYASVKKWFLALYKEDFKTKAQLKAENKAQLLGGNIISFSNKKD